MIGEPQKRISPMALKVWKIYGVLESLIVAALAVGAIVLTYIFDWSHWVTVIAVGVVILFTYLFVFLLPTIKWKRWRYEVREQEIELQRGILIVNRTLVPHVDTVQGPILKRYGLSTITISTAANVHEIPALDMEEADELRNSISQLARVAEDDV